MTDTDMLYMASLEKRNAELEARVAELEEKHWSECGQIAHYDDERKKIREYLQHSAKTMTVHGVLEALALIGEDTNVPASADDTNVGHKSGGCEFCPYGKTNPDGACDVERLRKAIEGVIKNG